MADALMVIKGSAKSLQLLRLRRRIIPVGAPKN
jgi:hypothetical protein